jgi:hypothetical protein
LVGLLGLDVDQPAKAMHLTFNLDVAFELIEEGSGTKPLTAGDRLKEHRKLWLLR